MKKQDIIFWSVLGVLAIFLLLKGNDIHRDHYKNIEQSSRPQPLNKNIEEN